MNVLDLIRAAGPLLWVLIALSLYVVYLSVARAQALSRLGRNADALIERARAITAESGPAAALAEVDRAGQSSPAINVLRAGLGRADRGVDAAGAAMQSALLAEDTRLYAGLSALGTAAQIAPLLGLLGTVIGMVRSFLVFSSTAAPTPAQLATGISEALVNTAGGLIVAIIAYVARNALKARADRIAVAAERVREDLPGWLARPEGRPRPERQMTREQNYAEQNYAEQDYRDQNYREQGQRDQGQRGQERAAQPQGQSQGQPQNAPVPVLAFNFDEARENAGTISSGPNNTGIFRTTTPPKAAPATRDGEGRNR
ncbi:MotA/TolQ/ExbB proton channel family protein [Deinococcus marmoris]|uniref:MotA/TolQ/ExbB proton channel family protein n=1 Tax=Deinococcus marmoris TaxID=249408 RepID=A0A1U7NWC4_9DEIO|nr:MotA/TolQ/ExbB proton channel family protein [Deinococcus marmoris]